MNTKIFFIVSLIFSSFLSLPAQDGKFKMTQIGSNNLFDGAWEIHWGPDDQLWVSERVGKKIFRVNPNSGEKNLLYFFDNAVQDESQNGLLGIAIHPELGKQVASDFVYASYTYIELNVKKQKIVRLTYSVDNNDGLLSNEVDVLTGLPSSNDHNSGRLIFGPDDKLYYTIGDQGANRSGNACNPNLAQVLPSQGEVNASDFWNYAGKTLRINLDGSIPEDNPILDGVRSHIFTYGHRNAQGLVFSSSGFLYSDEHGDNTDDEINLLQAGKNYGWPHVAGYIDDKKYQYCNYSVVQDCEPAMWNNYECNAATVSNEESNWSHPNFMPPMATMFTVENSYNLLDPTCASNWICRPNVAPSSLDIYENSADAIPGWGNSLLVVSLKRGRVYRYELAENGLTLNQNYTEHWNTVNRYRDIAIQPNGKSFYMITDNAGGTEAADGENRASDLQHPGALLKFQYFGFDELDADNTLSKLTMLGQNLTPTFSPEITTYSVIVQPETTFLFVVAGATSSLATVSVGDFDQIPGTDTVKVYAENGVINEYTIEIKVFEPVTLNADQNTFRVYPNPTLNDLTIEGYEFSGDESFEMSDLSGRRIEIFAQPKRNHTFNVDISQLQKGIYFLRVIDGSRVLTQKIFKM